MYLSKNLRNDDLMELKAGGRDPLRCLIECYETSDRPFTGIWDGIPCTMFGMVRIKQRFIVQDRLFSKGIGAPWLLGTEAITDARWQFVRESKKWLSVIESDYDFLWNHVHSKNTVHIRWLKWLGFKLGEDIVYPSGETFHEFSKAITPCAS